MAKDKAQNIPTLDDVVEPGVPAEEGNDRLADAQPDMDAVYDDDLIRLCETAGEFPAARAGDDAAPKDTGAEQTTDGFAAAPADAFPEQPADEAPAISIVATDAAPGANIDTAEISMSADAGPVTDADIEQEDGMWLQDWQEENIASTILDEDLGPARDAGESYRSASVNEDGGSSTAAQASPDSTGTARPGLITDAGQLPQLVDEIVREILPEIEWKLRTRIREVLEQHLDDD